ncbi:hypothetical protein Tco_1541617 [Tanacetum coccineum]
MLAISLFPTTFAEPMAKMVLKEAQGLWMAWIYSLKSLTKETQEEEAEDIAYSINRVLVIAKKGDWRDLPRDNPLVSVEVLRYDIKRSKSENKGIVPTEIELVLEQTQQGFSHELSMEILLEPTSNKLMVGKLGDSDVHTLVDLTLTLEILSRRFFLRLNLPDHRLVLTGSGGSSKDRDGDTSFHWSLFHNCMLILD